MWRLNLFFKRAWYLSSCLQLLCMCVSVFHCLQINVCKCMLMYHGVYHVHQNVLPVYLSQYFNNSTSLVVHTRKVQFTSLIRFWKMFHFIFSKIHNCFNEERPLFSHANCVFRCMLRLKSHSTWKYTQRIIINVYKQSIPIKNYTNRQSTKDLLVKQ